MFHIFSSGIFDKNDNECGLRDKTLLLAASRYDTPVFSVDRCSADSLRLDSSLLNEFYLR